MLFPASDILSGMGLRDDFNAIIDSVPQDWTDLELDLRIDDESHYVDAAVFLTQCNAQPYSQHDWHWRLHVANQFGHAAASEATGAALALLDGAGITGEIVVREVRCGRSETVQMWGQPEAARRELRARRGI